MICEFAVSFQTFKKNVKEDINDIGVKSFIWSNFKYKDSLGILDVK